jgi:hypothetical protein
MGGKIWIRIWIGIAIVSRIRIRTHDTAYRTLVERHNNETNIHIYNLKVLPFCLHVTTLHHARSMMCAYERKKSILNIKCPQTKLKADFTVRTFWALGSLHTTNCLELKH